MLPQLLANGIVSGCVYALVALGLGLIYNTTKIFHIAHGVVYTLSAYIFYTFAKALGINIFLSFLLGVTSGVLLGVAIEAFVYWPFFKKKASLMVVFISSLGIYILLVNLIALIYGNETKILSPGVERTFHMGSVVLTRIQILEVLAFLLAFPLFILILKTTKLGRLIRALSDNPELVAVLGADVRKLRIWIFGLGSLLAGVASCLVALDVGIDPHVGIGAFLMAAVAMIVGGIGNFEGAALGAFLLGVVQNLLIWKISARWTEALAFLILVLFLLFRPEGLLGRRRRLEEA